MKKCSQEFIDKYFHFAFLPDEKSVVFFKKFGIEKTPTVLIFDRNFKLACQKGFFPEKKSAGKLSEILSGVIEEGKKKRKLVSEEILKLSKMFGKLGNDKKKTDTGKLLVTLRFQTPDEMDNTLAWAREALLSEIDTVLVEAKLMVQYGYKEKAMIHLGKLEKMFSGFPFFQMRLKEVRKNFEIGKVGIIETSWWRGGALGVAYYTGPYAQKLVGFELVGKVLASELDMPYLEIHREEFIGNKDDTNGVLLYPDGAARTRLLIFPGGVAALASSSLAGMELTEDKKSDIAFVKAAVKKNPKIYEIPRKIAKQAFNTGMNYVGSCGGFFIAASGWYKVPKFILTGFALWPGKVHFHNSGRGDLVLDLKKDHVINQGVPGGKLVNLYFNGGPTFAETGIPGTEFLGTLKGIPVKDPKVQNNIGLMAYRNPDCRGGRLVVCSGHPEVRHQQFLYKMARYAMAHKFRIPEKEIEKGKELKAIIGDKQFQIYRINIPKGTTAFSVEISGTKENVGLYLRNWNVPTLKKSDKHIEVKKEKTGRIEFANPPPGLYFIGVYGNHLNVKGSPYVLKCSYQ